MHYEYTMGSTRECEVWYGAAEPVLGEALVEMRYRHLEEIRRLTLATIKHERGK
jgi:hypothetical protein